MMTRRVLLAAGLGLTTGSRPTRSPVARTQGAAGNDWFWTTVEHIEARVPDGGPSNGVIEHSRYGIEAPRAGRVNPNGGPPALADFYVKARFAPDTTSDRSWDVGFVWRVDEDLDALWWTIDQDRRWALSRGIWAITPRDGEEITDGRLCDDDPVETPVHVQALVAGSRLACSVNGSAVVNTELPERQAPGHVGIVANLAAGNAAPDGATAYRGLTLWAIERDDISPLPEMESRSASTTC